MNTRIKHIKTSNKLLLIATGLFIVLLIIANIVFKNYLFG